MTNFGKRPAAWSVAAIAAVAVLGAVYFSLFGAHWPGSSDQTPPPRNVSGGNVRAPVVDRDSQRDTTPPTQDRAQAECLAKLQRRGVVLQSGPCIDIDKIIVNLDTGRYSFNKPDHAYVDQSFPIVLVLNTASDQDPNPSFKSVPGARSTIEAAFAQHIEAELSALDMKIEPAGPQIRTATTIAPVEWRWNVTPLKSGTKQLLIEVNAGITIGNDRPSRVQLKVLREAIDIRVTLLQWVKSQVSEASGIVIGSAAMLTAFIGVLGSFAPIRRKVFRFLRQRRPRKRAHQQKPDATDLN